MDEIDQVALVADSDADNELGVSKLETAVILFF